MIKEDGVRGIDHQSDPTTPTSPTPTPTLHEVTNSKEVAMY